MENTPVAVAYAHDRAAGNVRFEVGHGSVATGTQKWNVNFSIVAFS